MLSEKPLSLRSLPDWALQAIERLQTGQETELDCLWADPGRIFRAAGMEPDPWQRDLLSSPAARLLVLCTRQAGKSETAAALALHTALFQPGSLTLLVSPSLRRSVELFRKVLHLHRALGRPLSWPPHLGPPRYLSWADDCAALLLTRYPRRLRALSAGDAPASPQPPTSPPAAPGQRPSARTSF